MSENVLVTGVAGFIGSHVAAHCVRNGMNVTGLDDLSGGFLENVPSNVGFVQGSITDTDLLSRLFEKHRFRHVYHMAAYAAEGLSHFIRRFNYQTNVIGSINLINASVNYEVSCFIFASSIAVYGANQTPMTEELMPQPEDPYGVSKYAVELDLAAARHVFGLRYIIFRPHNVYGERQNIADKYRNVIGIFMNQAMQGQPMSVFGDGTQTRAFSHIDDVAPLIAESPRVPVAYDQIFNIGADKPYSILELANVVAGAFGVDCRIIHHPARKEVQHAFSSHEKITRVFGSRKPTCLQDGIERMAKWAKERGPTHPVAFNDIEIYRCLPASWKT